MSLYEGVMDSLSELIMLIYTLKHGCSIFALYFFRNAHTLKRVV